MKKRKQDRNMRKNKINKIVEIVKPQFKINQIDEISITITITITVTAILIVNFVRKLFTCHEGHANIQT